LASLFSRDEARAGHDGTNILHLGEANVVAPGARTFVTMDVDLSNAFQVQNVNSGDGAGALRVLGSGRQPALTVESDASAGGPGFAAAIRGVSSGPGFGEAGRFGEGNGIGVAGTSRSGPGIRGDSREGVAVEGRSESGFGGMFSTEEGDFSVHVGGKAAAFALGVDNGLLVGSAAGGILAISRGGKPAIEGDALPSEFSSGIGVQGVSGSDQTFGQGPGIGVQGISGTGIGVEAVSENGLALRTRGKSAFSTAGAAVIPAKADSVFVTNPAVTGDSHISVTLASDPGPRQLQWVERNPGSGFTVHLSPAPVNRRPETRLTYLVIEPGMP
jgi:hypothetical protein